LDRRSGFGIREDRAYCKHGSVEPLRDFAMDALQPAYACGGGIDLSGKLRTVSRERVQLASECLFPAVRGLPPLHGCREGIKRECKTLARSLDRTWLAHGGRNSLDARAGSG
jgi:hypothetical protein